MCATDVSVSIAAYVVLYSAYMCANFPSIDVDTVKASSSQGGMHSLITTSFCRVASTCALSTWASLILASHYMIVTI